MELIKRVAAIVIVVVILNTFGLLRLALVIFGIYLIIELAYRGWVMWKGRDYDDGKR